MCIIHFTIYWKQFNVDETLERSKERGAFKTQNITSIIINQTVKTRKNKLNEETTIFFSVKTTELYHAERLPAILKTWVTLVSDQVCYIYKTTDII